MKDAGNLGYFVLMYAQVFVLWHLILVWAGLRGAGEGCLAPEPPFWW